MKIINKVIYKMFNIIYLIKLRMRISGGKGILVQGRKDIVIGQNVSIGRYSWLASLPLTGEQKSILKISNNCYIGNFAHIYSTKSIIIEDKVLVADRVYISDNIHCYDNPDTPIIDQGIIQKLSVRIGTGSWIGENVCIIGASIGKHCVIGANSVVSHDIPDYCVAVGAPSHIVKRYDFESKEWKATYPNGDFL